MIIVIFYQRKPYLKPAWRQISIKLTRPNLTTNDGPSDKYLRFKPKLRLLHYITLHYITHYAKCAYEVPGVILLLRDLIAVKTCLCMFQLAPVAISTR
jgi:hypothetical protein